jgi:histidyl-tRNA synthetase
LINVAKLLNIFQKNVDKLGYDFFLQPDIEKIEDLEELKGDVVFFVDKSGNLSKLRNDYTKSVINHLKRNNISRAKFWYSGFVYRYSVSNGLFSQYQLGLEKIPFGNVKDGVEIIRTILESYIETFSSKLLLEIGDSRVIEEAVKDFPEQKRKEVLKIVDTKNTAELEVFGELNDLEVEKLLQIIYSSFEKRKIGEINQLNIPYEVKRDVEELLSLLPEYTNVEIEIDFSIARTVEEYHGLTFTIYDLSTSKLVAAGGKYRLYDDLYGIGGTIFLEDKAWLI